MGKAYIGPDAIIQKKKDYMIPCVYHFYQKPMQIVRGDMQYVYDQDGRQYLDFYAGVTVVNAGHCNPRITDKICEQVKTLQHTTTIFLTQPIVDLAERLAALTPGDLQMSFFCNSGSEANEGSVLLAKLHTGRNEMISLYQSLHGRTHLTMSLTGLSFWRTEPNPAGGISFAPNAYCYRCPLNAHYPECDIACASHIEKVIRTSTTGRPAALIAEPIQGNGGIITPPPGYFQKVKEILEKYGALLIADEVQTGFARTGKMFAMEHWDVVPDVMSIAKALANGTPVGAFMTTREIAASYSRPGASTLGGNPVTAAAALATLDVMEEMHLAERARELGAYMKEGLMELQKAFPLIGDVRGLGLMLGVELVEENKAPASEKTDEILEKLKDKGFLAGKTGPDRNVLTFQPPLVIEKSDIDLLLTALKDILSALEDGR